MITSETWYYQIMNLMDVDTPFIGFFYCLMIIMIGEFFLLNLILAVIVQAFIKQHEKELEEQIRRLEDFNLWS
jgi:Ion transport protein